MAVAKTREDIRDQIVYDTNAFFRGSSAATSMDRYNFHINRVYRQVLNDRLWKWRLFTETLNAYSTAPGVFALPTTTEQVHSFLDSLPTTSPDAELGNFTEDRATREVTFKNTDGTTDTARTVARLKHIKIVDDLDADTDVPIFPNNFHEIIYEGVMARLKSILGERAVSADHGARFNEMLRKMRVNNVIQLYNRNPPGATVERKNINGGRLNLEE